MQDETKGATEPKSKGKGKGAKVIAAPLTSEAQLERTQIARAMMRAIWIENWIEANPDKSAAERGAEWQAVRQDVANAELKKMRRVVAGMIRLGVTMTMAEKPAKAEAEGESAA